MEEEYIAVSKQGCFRERNYRECFFLLIVSIQGNIIGHIFIQTKITFSSERHALFNINITLKLTIALYSFTGEMMISRARSYGSQTQFKQAQDLKAPSCERLAAIGITKYMPY